LQLRSWMPARGLSVVLSNSLSATIKSPNGRDIPFGLLHL
jgi:hypothetical protein